MARTKGALNKKTLAIKSAGDVTRSDGYAEAFTGLGTGRDRSSFVRSKATYILQRQELEDMYLGDGYARKVVDVVAEECTRAGICIEGIEDESIKNSVQSKIQELNLMQHINKAMRWSRLFGGALIIYGFNDGGALDAPLNDEGIKDVEFLRVYDRWQCTVQRRYTDPLDKRYGNPELWLISPNDGNPPYTVHSSRCAIIDGDDVPDFTRQLNQGWGASVLQAGFEHITRLGTSHQWANAILERNQQAIHKIPNLADTLKSKEGEALIRKRVDVVDMVRGILNTIVVDAQEDYSISTQSLSGVPDILDRFVGAVSAVYSIPLVILQGQQSGGLNATSKGELDAWYGKIEAVQQDKIREPIDKAVTYIIRAITGGDIEYELKFNPLKVLSEKEEAEVEKLEAEAEKIEADTRNVYVQMAALDADEVRKEIAEDYGLVVDNMENEE